MPQELLLISFIVEAHNLQSKNWENESTRFNLKNFKILINLNIHAINFFKGQQLFLTITVNNKYNSVKSFICDCNNV